MNTDVWRRIKSIASAALELPGSEWESYVEDACAGDLTLRLEVASLVRAAIKAEGRFESLSAAVATDAAAAGVRVGPYRLVRELGSGGMGTVFLAERIDGEFEQRVAIKVIRGGFGATFLVRRFRDERQILASLDHPHIARLIDGGTTTDGLPYVVMEYVEGEPIDVFCQNRRLTLRQRLDLFREVCAAMQYAHQRLVVHRDIKAANILVTADGTPKLLDFGIAKLLTPGLSAADQTTTIHRVMTPESASPEQLKGEPITVAADVYALGVLLYRLLTARSPYEAALHSEQELLTAVCEQIPDTPGAAVRRPSPIAGAVGAVPADVDVIVMKALRKEPTRRYGSAEQLSDDVGRFLEGHPVLAAPDSATYRARKFVRRHRIAVAAVTAVGVAISLGAAATLWQARIAQRERARAEREFNAVRTLANAVLGELYDSVARLPNSIGAREILLRRASEYLDTLTQEVGGNITLRREAERGYERLAQLQGFEGMENLGDRETARRSYSKAAALLLPIVDTPTADPSDRATLAGVWLRLGDFERDRGVQMDYLHRARALIESLSPDARNQIKIQKIETLLWFTIGNHAVDAKDYNGARAAYENEVRAAEAYFRSAPDDLDAGHNLSLSYKQLGAVLEELETPEPALVLYEKALVLDRTHVERQPARRGWRLDLSFAFASIGDLKFKAKDYRSALENYRQVVDLRRRLVAEEPGDEFASSILARGYMKMAWVNARLGNVGDSIDWSSQRLAIHRQRLSAHPERAALWKEYAGAAVDASSFSLEALESPATSRQTRRQSLLNVRRMLDDLSLLTARWSQEHRGAPDLVPPEQIERLRERLRRLSHA
jgi:non-specific serine/threonine protein kinase/serine/threonine-protein kinase